jgi:hypothetical protein
VPALLGIIDPRQMIVRCDGQAKFHITTIGRFRIAEAQPSVQSSALSRPGKCRSMRSAVFRSTYFSPLPLEPLTPTKYAAAGFGAGVRFDRSLFRN